jgi:hypothetical protein
MHFCHSNTGLTFCYINSKTDVINLKVRVTITPEQAEQGQWSRGPFEIFVITSIINQMPPFYLYILQLYIFIFNSLNKFIMERI